MARLQVRVGTKPNSLRESSVKLERYREDLHPLRYVDQCRSVLSLATHTCSMEGHYKDHRQDNTRLIGGTLRGSQGGHSKAQSEDTTRITWRTLRDSEGGHYKAKRENPTRLRGKTPQGSEGRHYKAQREDTTRLRERTAPTPSPPPPYYHTDVSVQWHSSPGFPEIPAPT